MKFFFVKEEDIDKTRFAGTHSDPGASGIITNVYVGQVRYAIDDSSTGTAQLTTYAAAKEAVDATIGDYSADGTYYLHNILINTI